LEAVCAIEHVIDKEDPTNDKITKAYPIAGELKGEKGKDLDAKWERLKTGDDGREGVRLEMKGGFKTDADGESKKYQKAVIKFICDKTRNGDEYNWVPEDKYDDGKEKREGKEEETDPEEDDKDPSLTYKDYNIDDDVDVLRLEWRTRYACEDYKQQKDAERRAHWGFFTWFIIMYVAPLPNFCQLPNASTDEYLTVPSYQPPRTSSSAHGSTTIDTAPAAGTSFLTVMRSEMFHT
jgi:hypothetical protein